MTDKLYALMDWPRIEAVVYAEENHPRSILGPHLVKGGVLIQGFFPEGEKVAVKVANKKKNYVMKQEDEAGFFSALIPGKTIPDYVYEVDGKIVEDPYRFPKVLTKDDEAQFCAGIHYNIYDKLGAHPMTIDGVDGVYFAVWAPNALRVSVVGDFNRWDGRLHPMEFLESSGIYELFIPGVKVGALYKFELKLKGGLVCLRQDPYGLQQENPPQNASIVCDLNAYSWKDSSYVKNHKKDVDTDGQALAICEINLKDWAEKEEGIQKNYKELGAEIAEYAKNMGFTHVELMPIMEYANKESLGYQTSSYYAPTGRYGNAEDFMQFVDCIHGAGVGVIMDWTPAHFAGIEEGLANFDGTSLYEHLDPRQGVHPVWGTCIFNYGRPQVKNFLIGNALFWSKVYHIDGIRMDGVSSLLYLDYCRPEGQWVPNMYGSNENLDGIEFLKHLNSIYKKKMPENLLIIEETTNWTQTTGEVGESCLGFDYKWNLHFTNDIVSYLSCDPLFRKGSHDNLTLSMWYNYMDRFILSLSRDEVVYEKDRLLNKMPGEEKDKIANLKVGYGFMMTHPGKKLFHSDEIFDEVYFKDLLELYRTQPALYAMDYVTDGFEWINFMDSERNIVTYLRKTEDPLQTLLVVCNFSNVQYDQYQVGVPYSGKYKEIFNSDAAVYGGENFVNPRVKMSRKEECDERENSIKIKVPALGISVFLYSRAVEKIVDNQTAKKKRSSVQNKNAKTASVSSKK